MPVRVNCPNCKASYLLPEDSLGKKLICQKCKQLFGVGDVKPSPAPGRVTTGDKLPPVAKTSQQRETISPEPPPAAPMQQPKKTTPLVLLAIAAVVLILGGVAAGVGVTALYFLKNQPTSVAETRVPQTEAEGMKVVPIDNGEQSTQNTPLLQEREKPAKPIAPNDTPTPEKPTNSPAPDVSLAKELPPDLDLVPGDGAIFLSLQVAKTWKDPLLAPVRKRAETDKKLANTLLGLKMMGLNPEAIERAVMVFWGKQATPYSVGLITMTQPYNRQLILGLVGDGQREEQMKDKSVISSPKNPFALHFIDERSFVYGRTGEVKKFLERPAGPTRNAVWNAILHSAPQHTFLIGIQHEAFPEDPKQQTPPSLKALNPLLDARMAVATLDSDKDLRLTARLMYAREDEVKQAESAARAGLDLASTVLGQFAEQFKAPMPGAAQPSLAKLAVVLQAAQTAVKQASIQKTDHSLECQLQLKSADWPEALADAAAMLFASESKSSSPGKSDTPTPGKGQPPESTR